MLSPGHDLSERRSFKHGLIWYKVILIASEKILEIPLFFHAVRGKKREYYKPLILRHCPHLPPFSDYISEFFDICRSGFKKKYVYDFFYFRTILIESGASSASLEQVQ